jgi:hypothetical protein
LGVRGETPWPPVWRSLSQLLKAKLRRRPAKCSVAPARAVSEENCTANALCFTEALAAPDRNANEPKCSLMQSPAPEPFAPAIRPSAAGAPLVSLEPRSACLAWSSRASLRPWASTRTSLAWLRNEPLPTKGREYMNPSVFRGTRNIQHFPAHDAQPFIPADRLRRPLNSNVGRQRRNTVASRQAQSFSAPEVSASTTH